MGYYATPPRVTGMIRELLRFPDKPFAALDPCCGEGIALKDALDGTLATTFGIEPDNSRSGEARTRLDKVLHSPIEDVKVGHKSFSLIWLNPPYDWEHGEEDQKCERKEHTFLRRSIPWLCDGGVLIYVIPESAWTEPVQRQIDRWFEQISAWKFPEPEYSQFKQMVVMAKRKATGRGTDLSLSRSILDRPALSVYDVPPTAPEVKLFMSTRLDRETVKTLAEGSPVWTRFHELTHGVNRGSADGKRPPLPLRSGHLAQMLAAGALDGIIGSGASAHVIKGKVVKGYRERVREEMNAETGATSTITIRTDQYYLSLKLLSRGGEIREVM
jgi:hypothetical protein